MSASFLLPEASRASAASNISCPAPFGHDYHGVPAGLDALAQAQQERLDLEPDLGDEDEVDVRVGQRGVAGDEAGMAAHQLDQAQATPAVDDASVCAERIDSAARANAVWKPKLWSIHGMSLSIVFGMPTTAMARVRADELRPRWTGRRAGCRRRRRRTGCRCRARPGCRPWPPGPGCRVTCPGSCHRGRGCR